MERVKNKADLKKIDADYCMVENQDLMYQRIEGEWYPRVYFKVKDVLKILRKDNQEVRYLLRKHGIVPPRNNFERINITLKQLRQMADGQ
jgi:hypothetical protein